MKELPKRINATKNEIALVHKGVYEEKQRLLSVLERHC